MTSPANCKSFITRGFLRVDSNQASTGGGAGVAAAVDEDREFKGKAREKVWVWGVEDRAVMRARSLADVSNELGVLTNEKHIER
jgi:hypothetical protein